MANWYIIYNFRLGGWVAKSGGLISDWQKAKWFTREEALHAVHLARDHDGHTCALVERALMEESA